MQRHSGHDGAYPASQLTTIDDPHMIGQLGDILAVQLPETLQKKHDLIVIASLDREKQTKKTNLGSTQTGHT